MSVALFDRNSPYLIYGIPALMILGCVALGFSPLLGQHPEFASAITIDLTITTPIVYLLLIRKTKIPRITAIPFFTGGIMIASYLIPSHQQNFLSLVKFWLLPVLEVGIFGVIGFAAYKTIKTFKASKDESPDMLNVLKITCAKIVDEYISPQLIVNQVLDHTGRKTLNLNWYVKILAVEAAVLYYGLVAWRGFRPGKDRFSYHKKSGFILLYGAIIFILIAETIVIHLVIMRWSAITAWFITIPSAYFCVQFFAHLKAGYQRPIEIREGILYIRKGIFGDAEIELTNVENVELASIAPDKMEGVVNAGLLRDLEQFNTIIRVKKETAFSGFYGIQRKFTSLLLYVDENAEFKQRIENYESN